MEKKSCDNEGIDFGIWLSRRRVFARLSHWDVSSLTPIKIGRIRALENGHPEKEITMNEAKTLSELYKTPLKSFISQIEG